ncbi:methyltransferase, partial [Klebsiella pneumoniae]|nr:methyltransferase [Klebsiella pneumoniae]
MSANFDFIIRIGVAGLLGAIIGIEREIRSKEAGLKTHFL